MLLLSIPTVNLSAAIVHFLVVLVAVKLSFIRVQSSNFRYAQHSGSKPNQMEYNNNQSHCLEFPLSEDEVRSRVSNFPVHK